MAVSLLEDGTADSLDNGDTCAGGQGSWYARSDNSGPAIIFGGQLRGKNILSSFCDLDTSCEVCRAEITSQSTTVGVGVNYADGASANEVYVIRAYSTEYCELYDRVSGTANSLGGGSTALSNGDKLAVEVTESGMAKAEAYYSGSWHTEVAATSCNTRSGDVSLVFATGTNRYSDDLYFENLDGGGAATFTISVTANSILQARQVESALTNAVLSARRSISTLANAYATSRSVDSVLANLILSSRLKSSVLVNTILSSVEATSVLLSSTLTARLNERITVNSILASSETSSGLFNATLASRDILSTIANAYLSGSPEIGTLVNTFLSGSANTRMLTNATLSSRVYSSFKINAALAIRGLSSALSNATLANRLIESILANAYLKAQIGVAVLTNAFLYSSSFGLAKSYITVKFHDIPLQVMFDDIDLEVVA